VRFVVSPEDRPADVRRPSEKENNCCLLNFKDASPRYLSASRAPFEARVFGIFLVDT